VSGGFKRSAWFGIVGLFVVAGACAAIGLTLGSGQSNPKLAYGLIFGILAIYFVILFTLQRGDLERTASGGAQATARAVAEAGHEIENPTTMAEPELWAALAVKPIDNDAIRARTEMWGAARSSLRLGMVVTLLIFLTVPSIYMFESFVPLLIGGPLIVIAALWGSLRALAPSGEMDKGYENVGRAMAPLGLEVTERPTVNIETRDAVGGSRCASRAPPARSRWPSPRASSPPDLRKSSSTAGPRGSSSPARAASSPTGSATSGSPSAWPTPELPTAPACKHPAQWRRLSFAAW
jgi:hypothetical protein